MSRLQWCCLWIVCLMYITSWAWASPASTRPASQAKGKALSGPTTHPSVQAKATRGEGRLEAQARAVPAPPGMAVITAGVYTPLYKTKRKKKTLVAAFFLDLYPVTNADYLTFVKASARWQRGRVPRLFADTSYLKHWPKILAVGDTHSRRSPVVHISWFAARHYCRWRGKRLPTVAEWEYVAAASKTRRRGYLEPGYNARILRWYSRPTPPRTPMVGSTFKNAWGVYDMHGLIWEWTRDFNSALVSGESRADSELERQLFCGAGAAGSSDFQNYAAFMRYAFRSSLKADYTTANLGFRCAMDIKSKQNPPTTRRTK